MNHLKNLTTFFLTLVMLCGVAQAQDQVLFSIEDEPVYLDEFQYIYNKTNRDEASYSKESVEEYLDLYTKFKLKVHKAKEMQLDTIVSLQQELAGYRKQLANAYMSDKEVLASLTKEAYERMGRDVSFSHILFKVSPNASHSEEERVLARAKTVLQRLREGEDFKKLVLEVSQDENARKNQGYIGYVTAMLPDGFYDLETAIYTLPPNTYSEPIKSKLGYHIVVTNGDRPARGELEVAQILIRNSRNRDSKNKMDSIYGLLEGGADFKDLARQFSEDKSSAAQGGYLGFFGINKYESIFENTAFRLQKDGDYSRPIRSSLGWHIIQRISHRGLDPFAQVERTLETKVKTDGRYAIAEKAMLANIKEKNGFKEKGWDRSKLLADLGDDFLQYKWVAPTSYADQTLFEVGDRSVTVLNFLQFLTKNAASRLKINKATPPEKALDDLYLEFVESELKAYEESQLENKYPEFKALMREYSEGILLFEATKMKVWDRASQDSAGLANYYKANPNKYLWPERALIETITINSSDQKVIDKVLKQAKKKSGSKLLKKMNKNAELIKSQSVLRGKEELDPSLTWTKNAMTPLSINAETGTTTFQRVADIVAPIQKTLDEARGYIIADYQDYLEKEWVKELTREFEVKINNDVLSSIIK